MTEVYKFQPTQIPGCSLWLDAADSTTFTLSGSTVTQWRDKVINLQLSVGSGTNTLTQNAFGDRPAVLFNGGYLLSLSSVFTATENVNNINQFVVMKRTGNTTYGLVAGIGFYTQNTKNSIGINANQAQIIARRGWTTNNTRYDGPLYANMINQGYIYSALTDYQASTYQLLINGSSNTATAFAGTGTTTSDTSLIYVGSDSFNEPFYGYVAEYIIYNTALTTSQVQQIEGYLAWKWGITKSLPTTHPRYNNPPFSRAIPLPLEPSLSLINSAIPPFNPRQISGCSLWLDAADTTTITLSGSTVTQWRDKSGNANHAILDTNKPIYIPGNRYVETTNNNTHIQLPSAAFTNTTSQTASIFIVYADKQEGTNNQGLFATLDYGLYQILRAPTYAPYLIRGNINSSTEYTAFKNRLATTNAIVYFMQYTAGITTAPLYTVAVDGNTFLPISGNAQTVSGNVYLGGVSSFDSAGDIHSNLKIYEIVVFKNTVLSTSQRQEMEGYFTSKWSLQSSLQSTHPYKAGHLSLTVTKNLGSAYFNPLGIANCCMWMDAADSTTYKLFGSKVSEWRDKSTSGFRFTQTNASQQPSLIVNARTKNNLLRFTSSLQTNLQDGTLLPVGTNPVSMSGVIKTTSSSANMCIWAKATSSVTAGKWSWIRDSGSMLMTFEGPSAGAWNPGFTDTYPANTYRVMTMVCNRAAGNTTVYTNGTLNTTKNFTPDTTTNLTSGFQMLIGNYNAAGWSLDGDICELIFYTTALSRDQRQKIEGYLAWKWGLQDSLPSTHPWVLFPPPPFS
jgi:hypothetical protein